MNGPSSLRWHLLQWPQGTVFRRDQTCNDGASLQAVKEKEKEKKSVICISLNTLSVKQIQIKAWNLREGHFVFRCGSVVGRGSVYVVLMGFIYINNSMHVCMHFADTAVWMQLKWLCAHECQCCGLCGVQPTWALFCFFCFPSCTHTDNKSCFPAAGQTAHNRLQLKLVNETRVMDDSDYVRETRNNNSLFSSHINQNKTKVVLPMSAKINL